MSRVVIDIETNSAIDPKKVWLICCRDLDTGEWHEFRNVVPEEGRPTEEAKRFLEYAKGVSYWVGHNWLEFDYPWLRKLVGLDVPRVFSTDVSCDTLVLSRLVNYSRGRAGSVDVESTDTIPSIRGHSIESYGEEFGYPKGDHQDFTKYSPELEVYCRRDVEICARIYHRHCDKGIPKGLELEQSFQEVVNSLHDNGFYFNTVKANKLLETVTKELGDLDAKISEAFPPRQEVSRTFTPKATKFGTISKTSVPRSLWEHISEYEVGTTYPVYATVTFNPGSHKQLIEVLHAAHWRPTDKTQSHIEVERELNRLKRQHNRDSEFDISIKTCEDKLHQLAKYGWRINENNLSQLPPDAPPASKLLAKRILLESRRRTLTEWLGLVSTQDGRIHGKFYGLGAWTHRMAHQAPNTANIPNEYDTQGKKKLLGKEMRSLWCAPKGRLLVGVDAEGIQLRIFAHLINDKEFTDALVKGRKDTKTDPHSLNQQVLGSVCASRASAKRFIYALLLGAGINKLAQILECSVDECREALDRLLRRYSGWSVLREEVIPKDARRGWFVGLDGRKVVIPGSTVGERKHLAMSGYLQSGEAIVMKKATVKFFPQLKEFKAGLVNFVHDEWQTETSNNVEVALSVAKIQSETLQRVGEELGLKCPLAGSYYNDDIKDYTIGTNWSVTH